MFTETVERINGGLARLLEAVRAGDLPAARLKDLIAASRAWEAKVVSLQTDAARLISDREGHGDGGASVLRDQAGKSRGQARRSLGAAEVLDEMPSLRGAVDSGEVPLANAERLADAARRTAPEAVDSASDLLAMARELPPDRFAREAGAWAQRHQSDHGHSDWINKRRRRYLKTWKQQDGMVRLDGLLDPETGTRICNRLQDTAEELRRQDQQTTRNRAAAAAAGEDPASGNAPAGGQSPTGGDATASGQAPSPGEGTAAWSRTIPEGLAASGGGDTAAGGSGRSEGTRSWDQLRADALDLLTSGAADDKGRGGTGGRPKAEVIVVADIGALTGDDPAGRCEIPGTGPMPPEVLQRIACDAQLTGLLFSDGKPLHHGSTVRTATTAQWRMLIARDRGCIGCGAEPGQCQAHHITPYARLRRTDIENLVLVCWRCHHNIHDHHWQVTHRNGKPALQPPDPLAPPGPADGRHPHDQNPREPRRPRPGRGPQPARARAEPAPTRPGSARPADDPDPPQRPTATRAAARSAQRRPAGDPDPPQRPTATRAAARSAQRRPADGPDPPQRLTAIRPAARSAQRHPAGGPDPPRQTAPALFPA